MEQLKLSKEQIELLERPLPKEALKAHPTKKDSSGNPMTTIKAIYVIDRLNDVFGIGVWQLRTEYLTHEKVVRMTKADKERTEYISAIHTTFSVPTYGIYFECVAGSTNDDLGDALKGGTTDGITKIASYLGIGADIWRGSVPSRPEPTPATPRPTATPTPARGGMTPNNTFELPIGLLEDLAKANTFEDLVDINKKYKSQLGDESVKTIFAQKMSEQFSKLPAEEQAKKR